MNSLLHLENKIRDAGAALGRLESELPKYPDSRSLRANLMSLRKLHDSLREEYDALANTLGIDVVHYTIMQDRPTARALARSIAGFQDAYALTFEARRSGPRDRRTFTPEMMRTTDLHAAYAFPGSFGIAFTIPNENLLLPDMQTRLEGAIAKVVEIAKAGRDIGKITESVRQLGKAPVMAIYEWAASNVANQSGACIRWRHDDRAEEANLQVPEFAAVAETIEGTSATTETRIVTSGTLLGADLHTHGFRFVPDGEDVAFRGHFSDVISERQQAKLPQRYRAVIIKTAITSYATEKDKISYFLESLEEELTPPPEVNGV